MIYFFSWESIVPGKLNGLLVYHPKRWQSIVKNKTIDVWDDCECCSGVISWLTFREACCAKGLCVWRILWTGPGWKVQEGTGGEWSDRGGMGWGWGFHPLSSFLFLPAFFLPHPWLKSLFTGHVWGWIEMSVVNRAGPLLLGSIY